MLTNRDITPTRYAKARAEKVKLEPGTLFTRIREPYFFSYVRDELIAQYGAATVRTGGLRVYTTIDPRLQRAAERAVRETLPYRTDPAAAVVSIDPRNGAIRAMTAVTPGKGGNQFNLVAQARRQAGSTFKTFVLADGDRAGDQPRDVHLRLGAVPLPALPAARRRGTSTPTTAPTSARRRSSGRSCARTTPSSHS